MSTVNLTPDETGQLSDAFKTAANYFQVDVIGLCDAYSALVGATIQLLQGVEFTDEQRRTTIETLQRQAEGVNAARKSAALSSDHLTELASNLDQRRTAAEGRRF